MLSIKSLRIKTVSLALIPIALVVAVVTVVTYQSIVKTARNAFMQRDTELARISAARLSENLMRYVGILQNIAASEGCRSLDPMRIKREVAAAKNWHYMFDGGIVVFDGAATPIWSYPYSADKLGEAFPFGDDFKKIRKTFRPVFSSAFNNPAVGEKVIMIGVPIVDAEGNFLGALAGMCTVRYSMLGVMYSRVLEFESGRSGYAYLVDGNGRVLYHRHSSLLGTWMNRLEPVLRVRRGETGAAVVTDATGEKIITGFAPVPGTGWGVVTQERWSAVSGPIQDYIQFFIVILWLGGIISGSLVFFSISRVLKPIQDLTVGTRRIADGDFREIDVHRTGDEIETLGRQFNIMARTLAESFASLEKRVIELNETQQALRLSRERFRLFMKHLPSRAFVHDHRGRMIYANDMHRRSDAPQPGSPVPVGSAAKWWKEVLEKRTSDGKAVLTGKVHRYEETLGEDGGITEWLTLRFPIFENDRPRFIGGIAVNITERKRAEEELARHRNRLEELVRERTRDLEAAQEELIRHEKMVVLGRLTATVSHELRNPLNVIRCSTYYLLRKHPDLDERSRAHLTRIEEQVELSDSIVNEILEYTRTHPAEPVAGRINPFISKALDVMELPGDIALAFYPAPEDPTVPFDSHKLRRAVGNLIDNAVNAVVCRKERQKEDDPLFEPAITVRTLTLPTGVRVEVEDNGVGMDRETSARAFEPLFTTRASGVGLGLAVVEKVAHEHGGAVYLESDENRGTLVILEIPHGEIE